MSGRVAGAAKASLMGMAAREPIDPTMVAPAPSAPALSTKRRAMGRLPNPPGPCPTLTVSAVRCFFNA